MPKAAFAVEGQVPAVAKATVLRALLGREPHEAFERPLSLFIPRTPSAEGGGAGGEDPLEFIDPHALEARSKVAPSIEIADTAMTWRRLVLYGQLDGSSYPTERA